MTYSPKTHELGVQFQLKSLLNQRGLEYQSEKNIDSTFNSIFKQDEPTLFQTFSSNEKRKDIRKTIFENGTYTLGEVEIKLSESHQQIFSTTFEWYVSKLLKEQFGFFTTGFGVQLIGGPSGTDFDVLGFGLDLFVHIECKTGNPNNIKKTDMENFKKKCEFLSADINVLYVDYNRIEEDSGIIKLFSECFAHKGSESKEEVYKISRGKNMEIYKLDIAPIFLIDTNKNSNSTIENLRQVFNIFFKQRDYKARHSGIEPTFLNEINEGYDVQNVE